MKFSSKFVATLLLGQLLAVSPALADESGSLICQEYDTGSLQYYFTDVLKVAPIPEGVDPHADKRREVYQNDFENYLNNRGLAPRNAYCFIFRTKAQAEGWRDSNIKENTIYRYTFSTISDWNPRDVPPPATAAKPQPAIPSGRRDSLIVRDPEGPPVTAKALPARSDTKPKPAVAAKPQKKATPCGRKGQRNCRAVAR